MIQPPLQSCNYHESRSSLNFRGLSWQCREFNESLAKQMKIYLYRNNMKPTTRQHRSKKQVYNDESAPRPSQHLGQSREIPKERSAAELCLGSVWKCQNHQLQKYKSPTPGSAGIIQLDVRPRSHAMWAHRFWVDDFMSRPSSNNFLDV